MNKNVRLFSLILISFLFIFFFANLSLEDKHALKIVNTTKGKVSGVVNDDNGIVSFKGIPFAKPPVDELRWKAPQEIIEEWKGIKKCHKFGPSPMQPSPEPFMMYTSEFLIPKEDIREDCLYLNVWTGAESENEKRPVFVWIYGGAFTSGGSAVPIYDGGALAEKGVVFVSINYRVGVFGFLAHPELTEEASYHASGNYGLLDQIAALKWVKENIAAFGGDPGNVTIAGQSAGSMSVNCQVASPLSRGLFHRSIAESGSNLLQSGYISENLTSAEERGEKLVESFGLSSIDELRKVSADEILNKTQERFIPIIDGHVLPASIAEIFTNGNQADVPLLTGWNADEAFISKFKSKEEFKEEAKVRYGEDAPEFLQYYPASTDQEAITSQIALSRDQTFGLSNFLWANIQSKENDAPAYVYYFERKPPATAKLAKYGSYHTAEVPYALSNLDHVNREWEEIDYELADMMSSFWVNFATNGDPNGEGLPDWPSYNATKNKVMIFDKEPKAKYFQGREALLFLKGH